MAYQEKKIKKYLAEIDGFGSTLCRGMTMIDKPNICLGKNIPENMLLDIKESGLYLGLEQEYGKGYYVGKRSEDDGNAMVIGINGSGKSYILAKSMIETWHAPFVALDFKGELSYHYGCLRHKGHVKRDYIIFDPFAGDITYEPFVMLKKDKAHFVQNVREIAYTIIPKPINDPNGYWTDVARDFLSAVIIYCFSIGLDFIETTIMAVSTPVSGLCHKIMCSTNSLAKNFISEVAGLKNEHQAIIGTDIKRHLMVFATDQTIQDVLGSDQNKKAFSWEDITAADDAPNVFLQLNQDRLEQWGGMIRLMLTQLIRTLERRPDKQSPQGHKTSPLLLLLDEFPLLGKLDAITNALTTLRSKKVTFCLMLQSIAQLDAVYGRDIRKIIVDNSQYKAILNITEPDSQEYFSKLIGTVPIGRRSISQSYAPTTEYITYGQQMQEFREPLILPHEFATNRNILLHSPFGLFSTVKLPVSITRLHVLENESRLKKYLEERDDYRRENC